MIPDYIRALVLDSDGAHVLMTMGENGLWDLPYFVFKLHHPDNYIECVTKLRKLLQIDDAHDPCFTVRTELLGRSVASYCRNCSAEDIVGNLRLVCMEMQIDYIDLPVGWEWKDAGCVASLEAPQGYDEGFQETMTVAAQVLNQDPSLMKQLSHPRHRPGWYSEASSWLRRVVEEQGGEINGVVSQFRVSFWTTILSVNSTKGRFFLKSPSFAAETKITLAIQELMPERTLEVVGVSEPLKSFISKGFELVYDQEKDEHVLHLTMVETLASMQLASMQYKEALLAAGCPLLGPDQLILELEEWMADEELWDCLTAKRRRLNDCLPQVKEYLLRLRDYNIPLTLAHGDFSPRNTGLRKEESGEERMIMFDWQHTAIAHPFFDFYEFNERLTGEGRDAIVDAYLQQWEMFEPLERCRELLEIAQPLGWLLRLRGYVSCFRTANQVSISETIDEIAYTIDIFSPLIEKIRPKGTEKQSGINESTVG